MDKSHVSSTIKALCDDSRVLSEEAALVVDLNRKFSCWRDDQNLRKLSMGRLGFDALFHQVVQNRQKISCRLPWTCLRAGHDVPAEHRRLREFFSLLISIKYFTGIEAFWTGVGVWKSRCLSRARRVSLSLLFRKSSMNLTCSDPGPVQLTSTSLYLLKFLPFWTNCEFSTSLSDERLGGMYWILFGRS